MQLEECRVDELGEGARTAVGEEEEEQVCEGSLRRREGEQDGSDGQLEHDGATGRILWCISSDQQHTGTASVGDRSAAGGGVRRRQVLAHFLAISQ